MIIYRAYFFDSEDYDQKVFLKNLKEIFKWSYDSLHIHSDNYHEPCYLFEDIDQILYDVELRNAVGVKIYQFNLDENQCKELLISKFLQLSPEKIIYYSYNETTEELEEFTLKAFL